MTFIYRWSAVTILLVATLAACMGIPNANQRYPTCDAWVGMSENDFLGCACFTSDNIKIQLLNETHTAYGIYKTYSCYTKGRTEITVSVMNGKVTAISYRRF